MDTTEAVLSGINGADVPESTQDVSPSGDTILTYGDKPDKGIETNEDSESIRQFRTIADQPEFQKNGGFNQKIQNDDQAKMNQ